MGWELPEDSGVELHFVAGILANVEDAGVEDQVLPLDDHQRAHCLGLAVQIEAADPGGKLQHRIVKVPALGIRAGLDGLQAKAPGQRLQPLGQLGQQSIPLLVQIYRLQDRKSTRLNSSHVAISYAVFCLKKTD